MLIAFVVWFDLSAEQDPSRRHRESAASPAPNQNLIQNQNPLKAQRVNDVITHPTPFELPLFW